MFRDYIKERIWKPVLCALMASCLSICMFQGFNLDQHRISDSLPVTFLLSLMITTILTVFSYNRRSIITGVAVMLASVVIFFISLAVRDITIHDELSSPTVMYIYIIIFFVSSVLVYLLASSRIGTAVLFGSGIYLIAGLKYLEFESRALYLFLFVAAAMLEFAFLEYNKSALESVLYRPDFTRFGVSTTAMTAAAAGMAALMFFAVIMPVHPGAKDLTLLTKHIAIENLLVTGIMNQYPVEDPTLKTDQTDPSSQEQRDENQDSEAQAQAGEEPSGAGNGEDETTDNGSAGGPGSGQEEQGKAVTYTKNINKLLLFAGTVLLAVILSIILKLLQRRLWLKRIREKSPNEQIQALYYGLVKKFGHLGMVKRPEDTPSVYASRNKRILKSFASGKADFSRLTGLFLRVRYGQFSASERDCRDFYKIYDDFYKNSRSYLGKLKYAKKFFFL